MLPPLFNFFVGAISGVVAMQFFILLQAPTKAYSR
jgi:hypothetical protein